MGGRGRGVAGVGWAGFGRRQRAAVYDLGRREWEEEAAGLLPEASLRSLGSCQLSSLVRRTLSAATL